ncbi:potassium transporter TrkA [bacterium]|nr:potassium transporter TrkA [bacterium]
MIGIVGIVAALIVLGLSLIVTRIAAVALSHTGLSEEAAKFQARSAFTGTGFTTGEAEKVVAHPVRRRVIMALMVARSAGLVSIIISLILSFAERGEVDRIERLGLLLLGVMTIWLLARSRWVERGMRRAIERALDRWTDLDTRDYAGLLRLRGPYSVVEMQVQDGDWVAGKTSRECRLMDEGVTLLGITRADGEYVGAPRPEARIEAGDTLLLYGRQSTLRNLSRRRDDPSGERDHDEMVDEHRRREAVESRQAAHGAAGDR